MTEKYTLVFGCDGHSVKAETLVNAMESFIESLSQIGYRIDPLSEIEYYVDATKPGSFCVQFRSAYKKTNKFLQSNLIGIIILGVFINMISDWIKGDNAPVVIVNGDLVKIEFGNQTVIIPMAAHKAYENLKHVDSIRVPVKKTFKALKDDSEIHYAGIEFTDELGSDIKFNIPESAFEEISKDDEIQKRENSQRVELVITRAILERSKRRWEFYYNSKRISCPILLKSFYDKFESHFYQIAPGDKIIAQLKILQEFDRQTNVWFDVSYEIEDVFDLIQVKRSDVNIGQQQIFNANGLTSR